MMTGDMISLDEQKVTSTQHEDTISSEIQRKDTAALEDTLASLMNSVESEAANINETLLRLSNDDRFDVSKKMIYRLGEIIKHYGSDDGWDSLCDMWIHASITMCQYAHTFNMKTQFKHMSLFPI